jgi:hypothetical protein
MKMEKKTLTSLAMITFLMTSTAVIAMAEGEEAKPGASTASTVQLKETEKQNPPLAASKKGWSFFGLFTWEQSDSSIKEASHISTPSTVLTAEFPKEDPIPTEEDLMRVSMSLTPDQLQQVLQAESSNNPETLRNAEGILNSSSALTVPSSAPVEPLSTEQESALRRLWNRFFGKAAVSHIEEPGGTSTSQVPSTSSSSSLSHSEEAIHTRTPGRIAIDGDDAPLLELSFPGDYKLADTLKDKRSGAHSPSVTPGTDEIKGDGFNYFFTVSKEQMAPLNNATLQFQVEMKSNAPAYIEYWDGRKEMTSVPHSGNGQWETLTVEFTVNTDGARWFNFYPAILPAVEGIEDPSTQIRNSKLYYKK